MSTAAGCGGWCLATSMVYTIYVGIVAFATAAGSERSPAKLQLNQLLMIYFFSSYIFFCVPFSCMRFSVSAMCYCVFVSMHTSILLCL